MRLHGACMVDGCPESDFTGEKMGSLRGSPLRYVSRLRGNDKTVFVSLALHAFRYVSRLRGNDKCCCYLSSSEIHNS